MTKIKQSHTCVCMHTHTHTHTHRQSYPQGVWRKECNRNTSSISWEYIKTWSALEHKGKSRSEDNIKEKEIFGRKRLLFEMSWLVILIRRVLPESQALEEVIQFMETPGISEPTHLNWNNSSVTWKWYGHEKVASSCWTFCICKMGTLMHVLPFCKFLWGSLS